MKTTVTFADPEIATKDLINTWLTAPASAGIGIPANRPSAGVAPAYVQVAWDGTPVETEIIQTALIRITYWAAKRADGKSSTSEAKRGAIDLRGRLLGYQDGAVISDISRGLGVIPGRDPDTGNELASFAVRVSVRSTPLT